ncbi:hypothetical protein [Paraburkholderia sp. J7]|uniref:hypothetical protein n=1 Tax=Paraburkholderia sp. J7 TaxID=2805438 RepID=UPI002AB613DB|nr:hypothetical protein [Paraburkholderia sp. J7]
MNDAARPEPVPVSQLSVMARHIDDLAERVYAKLVTRQPDGKWTLHDPELVAQRVARELAGEDHEESAAKREAAQPSDLPLQTLAEVFLQSVELLMASPHEPDSKSALLTWCGKSPDTSIGESEQIRVDLLTTSWLGLHFVGIPFSIPWERVRRWADEEGGGLPNGACIGKAIGDIVRDARKHNERMKREESSAARAVRPTGAAQTPAENAAAAKVAAGAGGVVQSARNPALIVFSGLPLLLFPELLRGEPREGCTPNGAHILGRCYELLQLVLYLRAGFQILYCVKEDIVVECLRFVHAQHNATPTKESAWKIWQHALEWLQNLVPVPVLERQYVCVMEDPLMPACFINHERGLYTVETPMANEDRSRQGRRQGEMPLPASYMREIRRLLYIEHLTAGGGLSKATNLLSKDANYHEAVFRNIWSRCQAENRRPAAGSDPQNV